MFCSSGWALVLACLPAWFRSNENITKLKALSLALSSSMIQWLRFVHCLRRYRDTRHAFQHLTNAGRITIMVAIMITFYICRKIHNNFGDQPHTFHLCHAVWCHRSGGDHANNIYPCVVQSISLKKVFYGLYLFSKTISTFYALAWDLKYWQSLRLLIRILTIDDEIESLDLITYQSCW